MNLILSLLQELRDRPGVFIGKKSLDRLSTFVYGYIYGVYKTSDIRLTFFFGFQEYVQERYGIYDHDWSSIISFYCHYEEEAFDRFYVLLDEFLELHPEITKGN